MSEARGEIAYGEQRITFSLRHADRQTLEIAVRPDGEVDVVAPLGTVYADIHARLVKRARWIAAQRAYFAQFDPRTPVRRFVGGETHLYLGRHYRLKISPADADNVRLMGGRFMIDVVGSASPERVGSLLADWYAAKADDRLAERLGECWTRFSSDRAAGVPPLRIRRMRARWGSMSEGGMLTLNVDLIRAPRECIDYVILHELCHLEYPDHGPGFRARLEHVLPDWRQRKHRLELTLS